MTASCRPADQPAVDLAGSGTFVELAGRHYILTADHVWNKVTTERWEELAVALAAEGRPLPMPRGDVTAHRLGKPPYTEWGPDLALLEVPPELVATIKAKKSFLNLAKRRGMLKTHPPRMEKTLWAVMGMVAETSEVKPRTDSGLVPVNIRGEAFFGVTCTADERGGYDYLTTYAKTTLPGVPASFRGVSGGGLWEIGLSMKKSTGEITWELEHHFRGVTFWEQPKPPNEIAIRCHGPQSVFGIAWKAWNLDDQAVGPVDS
jgi:hypothetical protein